jgi:hypothetical protein
MNKMEKFDQGEETLETDNAPSEYDASLREQIEKDAAESSGLETSGDPRRLRCWPGGSVIRGFYYIPPTKEVLDAVMKDLTVPEEIKSQTECEATSEIGSVVSSSDNEEDDPVIVEEQLDKHKAGIGSFRSDVNDGVWDQDEIKPAVLDETVDATYISARERYKQKRISAGFHIYKLVNKGGIPYHRTGAVKRFSVVRSVDPYLDKEKLLNAIKITQLCWRHINIICKLEIVPLSNHGWQILIWHFDKRSVERPSVRKLFGRRLIEFADGIETDKRLPRFSNDFYADVWDFIDEVKTGSTNVAANRVPNLLRDILSVIESHKHIWEKAYRQEEAREQSRVLEEQTDNI